MLTNGWVPCEPNQYPSDALNTMASTTYNQKEILVHRSAFTITFRMGKGNVLTLLRSYVVPTPSAPDHCTKPNDMQQCINQFFATAARVLIVFLGETMEAVGEVKEVTFRLGIATVVVVAAVVVAVVVVVVVVVVVAVMAVVPMPMPMPILVVGADGPSFFGRAANINKSGIRFGVNQNDVPHAAYTNIRIELNITTEFKINRSLGHAHKICHTNNKQNNMHTPMLKPRECSYPNRSRVGR
jgi:hypothetical protein